MIYLCGIIKKVKTMDNETFKLFADTFGNVCFPIACCIALFWMLSKQNTEIKNAIDNNTKVLTELTTLIKMLVK